MRTIELRPHDHAKPVGRPDTVHAAVCKLLDELGRTWVERGDFTAAVASGDIGKPYRVLEDGREVSATPAEAARVQGALMEVDAARRKVAQAM